MAQILKIKRSTSNSSPTTLENGELAYSSISNTLYIGRPGGTTGDIDAIGGKAYTDVITAATSLNTANTLVKRDSSGDFSAGTITADLAGNSDTTTAWATARNLSLTGDGTATLSSVDGTTNVSATFTLATVNSNVGTFGSSTAIPIVTVNAKGLVTAVSTASVATSLTLVDDSAATVGIDLLTENLTIAGGTLITTTGTDASQTITIDHDSVSRTNNTSASSPGFGGTFTAVDSITSSTEGHVTAVNTKTVTLPSLPQALDTTDSPTFVNTTLTGTLYGPANFTIDPSGHGDNTGTVIIAGNLTVNGTTTTVNSSQVDIGDSILLLNSDEAGSPSQNAGIEIERGTSANVSLLWNETTDVWQFTTDGSTFSNILSAANFETNITTIDGGTY